ncbi:MAG TPA: response regulator [Azonexus sp.]
MPTFSLSSRLWLVLALAIGPLLPLTIADFQRERQQAVAGIDDLAVSLLHNSAVEEDAARRQVREILRIMAGADNMRELDPANCSALAGRLLAVTENIGNIGAALPDGSVFCSAHPIPQPISVSDRSWFQEAHTASDVTRGQYSIGRISGKPGVTFGLPFRAADGHLRAVLFVAIDISWFDRISRNQRLPPGWSSLLLAGDGNVLSRHPDPDSWRGSGLDAGSRERLLTALRQGHDRVTMNDVDGVERLFLLRHLQVAGGQLVAAIGAPVNELTGAVDLQFALRLGLLGVVVLLSIVLARSYLNRLVERWVGQMRAASAAVATGDFSTRLPESRLPGELALINRRFNEMSAALAEREAQFERDRQAIEQLNRQLADRLAALEAAEQMQRRLTTAVEQSPTSIVITDTEARITYVNRAFTATSGYPAAEVLGQNPRLLQSGETPPAVYQGMWQTLKAGEIWRGELVNRRKDGSLFIEQVTISPVRGADGTIGQYVAVKEDVTERLRIERELANHRQHLEQLVASRTAELAHAKAAAEAANQAKSAFLANMSHEIRTPMNAIIGLNYLLLKSPVDAAQRDKLQKVTNASEHLLQVINDILDLSKIESGKLELERLPFSPLEVLQATAAVIRDQALGKGLQLAVEGNGLPARVVGDAQRLRQVLINFAGNALKFTRTGSIRLAGEVLADDGDTVLCRFTVSDTGVGIRADDLPRLFKPFEQLDASTTRQYGGTGLGLAIAQHLARLMDGEVGVDSTPGQGSRFWITARLGKAAPQEAPIPVTPGSRQLQGHVLLVEDEPLNREIGCDLLSAAGIAVDIAENGLAAVERAQEYRYDLILMDVQMPVLDGLDATRRIRSLAGGRDIPIVALTANAYSEDRQRCLAAGMDDFLAKPVEPEALYAILAKYLRAGASRDTGSPCDMPPSAPDAAALGQLADLLRTGDVEAGPLFNRQQAALQAAFPEQCAALRQAIGNYDYEAALPIVETMLKRLA